MAEVLGDQLASDIVTTERERELCEVVGAEREEVADLGQLAGDERRARCLQHCTNTDGALEADRSDCLGHPCSRHGHFGGVDHERDHHFHLWRATLRLHRDDGVQQRPHLHLVEPGLDDTQPHAAGADHRVHLVQATNGGQLESAVVVQLSEGFGDDQPLQLWQELMEGRVEKTDGDWKAVHHGEDALEVGLLGGRQFGECVSFLAGDVAENQSSNKRQTVVGQEHVLGAAQADAFGAEVAGVGSVGRVVGVGAHSNRYVGARANLICPIEQRLQLCRGFGRRGVRTTEEDLTSATVD